MRSMRAGDSRLDGTRCATSVLTAAVRNLSRIKTSLSMLSELEPLLDARLSRASCLTCCRCTDNEAAGAESTDCIANGLALAGESEFDSARDCAECVIMTSSEVDVDDDAGAMGGSARRASAERCESDGVNDGMDETVDFSRLDETAHDSAEAVAASGAAATGGEVEAVG